MWESLMNKRYLLRFTNCMVAKTCWTQTVINLRWYRIILIMFVVENEKCLGRFFVNATLISRNIIDSNWMTTQVPQTLGFKVTPCKWLKIYKNLLFHNNLAKRAENIWEIKISDFDAKGCKKFQSWENIGAAAPIRFALNHYHLMGWWFFVKEIMVLLLISTNRTSWQWIEYFIGLSSSYWHFWCDIF